MNSGYAIQDLLRRYQPGPQVLLPMDNEQSVAPRVRRKPPAAAGMPAQPVPWQPQPNSPYEAEIDDDYKQAGLLMKQASELKPQGTRSYTAAEGLAAAIASLISPQAGQGLIGGLTQGFGLENERRIADHQREVQKLNAQAQTFLQRAGYRTQALDRKMQNDWHMQTLDQTGRHNQWLRDREEMQDRQQEALDGAEEDFYDSLDQTLEGSNLGSLKKWQAQGAAEYEALHDRYLESLRSGANANVLWKQQERIRQQQILQDKIQRRLEKLEQDRTVRAGQQQASLNAMERRYNDQHSKAAVRLKNKKDGLALIKAKPYLAPAVRSNYMKKYGVDIYK